MFCIDFIDIYIKPNQNLLFKKETEQSTHGKGCHSGQGSEQDLIWNFLRNLFFGKYYEKNPSCSALLQQKQESCVSVLRNNVAEIIEPARKHYLRKENPSWIWFHMEWAGMWPWGWEGWSSLGKFSSETSSADGLCKNEMSKNHNQVGVLCSCFPGFPRVFPGWGCFPAEGTRHPRTAPAARLRPAASPAKP